MMKLATYVHAGSCTILPVPQLGSERDQSPAQPSRRGRTRATSSSVISVASRKGKAQIVRENAARLYGLAPA